MLTHTRDFAGAEHLMSAEPHHVRSDGFHIPEDVAATDTGWDGVLMSRDREGIPEGPRTMLLSAGHSCWDPLSRLCGRRTEFDQQDAPDDQGDAHRHDPGEGFFE
jgi:hypothetical protein